MSSPQTSSGSPSGGKAAAAFGSAFGGPVKPQPAAPLTDEQLRMECMKLVISAGVDPRFITASAERAFQYVKTGAPNTGDAKRGEGA